MDTSNTPTTDPDDHPDPDFDELQQLQIEVLEEHMYSGLQWDKRVFVGSDYHQAKTPEDKRAAALKEAMQCYAAGLFVQAKNKFFDVDTHVELSDKELFRILSQKIGERFLKWYNSGEITARFIDEISMAVVNGRNIDPRMCFGVYSGKKYMLPNNPAKRLFRDGYFDLNTWKKPAYRSVEPEPRDEKYPLGKSLELLLRFAIKNPLERQIVLDWLGWCLKNEHLKPKWAIFLFSQAKGTGKSSLLELAKALFGPANTADENGVKGLTQNFAADTLSKKFIKIEEVKLTSYGEEGNAMKEFITGDSAFVDVKYFPKINIPLKCAFMMTSNHRPTWLEGGERRYYIIEMKHEGHAHGTKKQQFDVIMDAFYKDLQNPRMLKRWQIELTNRIPHPDFDPYKMQPRKIGSTIMQELLGEEEVEVKAVLEDLLSTYSVEIIPSSDQQLLVNYLKLRNQQALRNLLKELGWKTPTTGIRLGKGTKPQRVWHKQSAEIRDRRINAPSLSEEIEGAIEAGATWWPLDVAIDKGWMKLSQAHLRPNRNIRKTTENKVVTEEWETGPVRIMEYNGPFVDSTTTERFVPEWEKQDLDF